MMLGVVIGVSYLSFRMIEKPARDYVRNYVRGKQVVARTSAVSENV